MLPSLKKLLKNNLVVFLVFLVLGFILYGNSLGNEMFWDDQDNILFNEYVHNWQHIPKYFTENNVAGRGLISNYWRPLPLTIWSIEWHLWQDWAPGYHFVQTALHIGSAFLLFILLNKLFNNRLLSVLTSILILVHPLQTEAITYVSGISDPLSAVLIFSSLIFYIKFRELKPPNSYLITCSLVLFSLSFLARETTVFFFGYFVLVEFSLHVKKYKSAKWPRFFLDCIKFLWPFLALALAYVFLRLTALNFQNTLNLYDEQNEFTGSPLIRLFTFLRILTIYVGLLFWPHDLHIERGVDLARSLKPPDVVFGLSVLIGSLSALIFFLKKNRLIVFAIAWVIIGLIPTSNILVPINGLLFEHWLYIPMIGVWLVLCWCLIRLSRIANGKLSVLFATALRQAPLICYMLFATFLSIRTFQQNRLWRDPITFYNYTLKFAPNSYRVLNNLGMAYAEAKQHDEAIRVYQLAIRENPENAVAYHNLGNTQKALGNRQLAIDNFEKAISLQPDFYFSYNALAQLYLDESDYKSAIEVLQRLLPYQTGEQYLNTQNLITQLQSQK